MINIKCKPLIVPGYDKLSPYHHDAEVLQLEGFLSVACEGVCVMETWQAKESVTTYKYKHAYTVHTHIDPFWCCSPDSS